LATLRAGSDWQMAEMEELLKQILNFGKKSRKKVFLVGGFLRDLLLGRETEDFDLVPEGNAKRFAKGVAREIEGSFVPLDEKNRIYRVVKQKISEKGSKKIFNLDFSQLRGKKIEEDLLLRDFSIDAMAVRLDKIEGNLKRLRFRDSFWKMVIDPCGGLTDLRKRTIRKVSPKIFNDDPLRLLRGYRLAANLGFTIEKKTEKEIRENIDLIKVTARERIRDELLKLLATPQSHRYIRKLERAGLLTRVIPEIEMMKEKPENYYHREGLWGHSLETLESLEEIFFHLSKLFPKLAHKIEIHLNEKISGEVDRKTLLKWAAIFHDIGKPKTVTREEKRVRFFGHQETGASLVVEIMEGLRFSKKAIRIVERMVEHHMRPGNLSEAPQVTDRAIHRFFRDLSEDGIDTLLLSLADRYSYRKILFAGGRILLMEVSRRSIKKHEATVKKMLGKYYYHKERILPKPIIRGNEIMEKFNLAQGPLIGKLLRSVEEAQAEGRLRNKEEAIQFLKKLLGKQVT